MLIRRFQSLATGLSDRMAEDSARSSQRKQECSYSVWKKCSGSVDFDIVFTPSIVTTRHEGRRRGVESQSMVKYGVSNRFWVAPQS